MPYCAIIVLNWNGVSDTISCLDSIFNCCYSNFKIFLIDNGSEYSNIIELRNYIESLKKRGESRIQLVEIQENLGFAKGNNVGISYASAENFDYILLLNNDTIIESDSLNHLVDFLESNKQYSVVTPVICYESDRNIIWNCGGDIWAGFRKYFYAGENTSAIDIKKSFFNVSFITGCALFFRPIILDNKGKLFTEKFFFGEEDFDFSLRMARNNFKMACNIDSRIYHKVSASTTKFNKSGKTYIYYLNRFIDVRYHYGAIFFYFWMFIYIPYIFVLLKRHNTKRIYYFIFRLIKDSITKNEVSKEDFVFYINNM